MRRVGIDLAVRAAHKAVVVQDGRVEGKPFKVPMDRAGMEALLERGIHGGESCEFVLEPTANAWQIPAAWLTHRGQRVLMATGQRVADVRKIRNRFAKTDGLDGEAAARVIDLAPEAVFPVALPSPARDALARLAKQRASVVAEATRHKLRVTAMIDLANPHLARALSDALFSLGGRVLVRKYLDPFAIQKLGRQGLTQFLRGTSLKRSAEKTADAVWEACEKTCGLLADLLAAHELPFDYAMLSQEVSFELDMLEHLESIAKRLDQQIKLAYLEVDPQLTLTSIKGVGDIIGAAIEGLTGDIRRFRNARAYVSFCGLAPRVSQTGQSRKQGLPMTKAGNRLLKHYLFLAAEVARQHDPEFAQKYAQLEAKGKHHFVIMVALAHMLARRIFSLLRRRENGPTAYALRDPTGQPIDAKSARALILERFPSKSRRASGAAATRRGAEGQTSTGGAAVAGLDAARKEADGSSPIKSGQSEDSAIRHESSRPGTSYTRGPISIANPIAKILARLAVENPVDNPEEGTVTKPQPPRKRCKKGVDRT